MQYALIMYEGPEEFKLRTHPEKAQSYWSSWEAYSNALVEAGIMRGGEGLEDYTTATTVSSKNGKRHVQDGPYADTKEQLGGFFVIDVPSLDVAMEWAAKSPAMAKGKIEIRPVMAGPPAK